MISLEGLDMTKCNHEWVLHGVDPEWLWIHCEKCGVSGQVSNTRRNYERYAVLPYLMKPKRFNKNAQKEIQDYIKNHSQERILAKEIDRINKKIQKSKAAIRDLERRKSILEKL